MRAGLCIARVAVLAVVLATGCLAGEPSALVRGRVSVGSGTCGATSTASQPCVVPAPDPRAVTLSFESDPAGARYEVTTSPGGDFTLQLPEGHYRIRVQQPRHLAVTSPVYVTLAAGQELDLTIMLQVLYAQVEWQRLAA